MKNRILALLLALTLCVGVTACGKTADEKPAQTPEISPEQSDEIVPEQTPEASADPEPVTVRFACLSGPTGVGAAKLMTDAQAGETSGTNIYETMLAADNPEIVAKLTNGDLDIACMASNAAANLYNKSSGGVQALCLSTLGVLYILERGEEGFEPTVSSMADLAGKTIYATGQGANPEYVLDYLLSENGVDPDSGVEIVWKTAEEVQLALNSGEAQFAMLPVPAAIAPQMQGKQSEEYDVRSVLDLTGEWNKVSDGSVLTMTTVVVRAAFAQEHPEAVEQFMADYQASIEYVNGNVEEAAGLIEALGIVPKAAIAKQAIPMCNLVFVTGEEMMEQITGYYEVLFQAEPASVGGAVPDAGFYYGVE